MVIYFYFLLNIKMGGEMFSRINDASKSSYMTGHKNCESLYAKHSQNSETANRFSTT